MKNKIHINLRNIFIQYIKSYNMESKDLKLSLPLINNST